MSFADIERTISELGEKVTETLSSNIPRKPFSFSQAKKSSLSIEDMDGGTFTIRYELFFFSFLQIQENLLIVMEEYSVRYSVHQLSILHNQPFSACMEYLIDLLLLMAKYVTFICVVFFFLFSTIFSSSIDRNSSNDVCGTYI